MIVITYNQILADVIFFILGLGFGFFFALKENKQ